MYDTIKRIDAHPKASFCTHSSRQPSNIESMEYKSLTDELSSLLFELIKVKHSNTTAMDPPAIRGRKVICDIIGARLIPAISLDITSYPQLQIDQFLQSLDAKKIKATEEAVAKDLIVKAENL